MNNKDIELDEKIAELEQKPDLYFLDYHCDNCGFCFSKGIIKGMEAPELTTCHHCLCHCGHKERSWMWPSKERR